MPWSTTFSLVFRRPRARSEEFRFFRQVTGSAGLARVFGESRRPQEGRVYRPRFVSGGLTTNSTRQQTRSPVSLPVTFVNRPIRGSLSLICLVLTLARISSGVVGGRTARRDHKCQVCVLLGLYLPRTAGDTRFVIPCVQCWPMGFSMWCACFLLLFSRNG